MSSPHIAVVGGGPAGLRAAEVAAEGGARVALYDAKPSVGRKFLVAGKSGLNLTNAEEFPSFLSRYQGPGLPSEQWSKILQQFDNDRLRQWAAELGIETFAASGGKVFPQPMKAAPLLRAWVQRLRDLGVSFHMRHRLAELHPAPLTLRFDTSGGPVSVTPDATVLALGGASWPHTGSTGQWAETLREQNVAVSPFTPANCGWEISWPDALRETAEGLPLKNIAVQAGATTAHGELVLTRYGLEGGPLYRLGPILREMDSPLLTLDLKPEFTETEICDKLRNVASNYIRETRRRLKLGEAACALLKHLPHLGPWKSPAQLAKAIKSCPLPLLRPRPVAEAISSAGGIAWDELDDALMIEKLPGLFVAGEMIDWEAPTGGYLLQACFATGTHAGIAATHWTKRPS